MKILKQSSRARSAQLRFDIWWQNEKQLKSSLHVHIATDTTDSVCAHMKGLILADLVQLWRRR